MSPAEMQSRVPEDAPTVPCLHGEIERFKDRQLDEKCRLEIRESRPLDKGEINEGGDRNCGERLLLRQTFF
jgi:hypothetical protein